MEKLIDLHVHTTYSDGEKTPEEIIDMAIERNIKTIAITDHDTLNGIKKVRSLNITKNIEIINGIELSVLTKKGRFHILGYDINLDNKELNDKMSILKDNSTNGAISILAKIKEDYGIRFTHEEIKELLLADHNVGRPDIAKLCIKHGYADSVYEAFAKYLDPAFAKTRLTGKGIKYNEAIELIKSSNGIPVLAHPNQLEMDEDEFIPLLEDMIRSGLRGIEVYHSTLSESQSKYYQKIAKEYNLLMSGGSDYHGPINKPDILLGTGRNNNLKIKELSLLDEIHRRR